MSAAKRRRGNSLHLNLSGAQAEELPPIVAAFFVTFDLRAGYTIAWQRSIPGLELDSSVEYKSLPSGLHNVSEDLIYFIQSNEYAGVSAYVNKPTPGSDRNANMLAVGVLVPSHGQLGKSWRHADGLKKLAVAIAENESNTEPLEEYWSAHQDHETGEDEEAVAPSPSIKAKQPQLESSANGAARQRNRAVSTASALAPPGQYLSKTHPATALPLLIETFGPLVFPLYKAALLRKRILISTRAPVETACIFVYNISVISGLPASIADGLPLEPLPFRLQPLFSVGVHDMDDLAHGGRDSESSDDPGLGWVACTTDDILCDKPQLYDYLIRLPTLPPGPVQRKVWPEIFDAKGIEIKATQRDLRRYRVLRQETRRLDRSTSPKSTPADLAHSLTFMNQETAETDTSSTLDADLAEPQSWSALAYNSFMWWASAGEKRTDLDEEEHQDSSLLRRITTDSSPSRPRSSGKSPVMDMAFEGPSALEMTLVAFFHRLTTMIIQILSELIDDADADESSSDNERSIRRGSDTDRLETPNDTEPLMTTQDGEDLTQIVVEADDMSRMGLDLWSESDRAFVEGLILFYWGRKADYKSSVLDPSTYTIKDQKQFMASIAIAVQSQPTFLIMGMI
ncbi:uncharacterized protein KY384_006507 [Bacidia gigantensis]|uniref:uncharacterized protein n=1 Tax=Bacidia gigantensis TaxID=2732470 RepID=UPI001D04C542|nr:uncharacterized protein KY384_006507 [Bacidia gigantensis]KAG8528818.1 hypothetical protein KY384_006507 [Bacidia gigantensis]